MIKRIFSSICKVLNFKGFFSSTHILERSEKALLPTTNLVVEQGGVLYTVRHYYGNDADFAIPVLMSQLLAVMPEIQQHGLEKLISIGKQYVKYRHSVGLFDDTGIPVAGAVFGFDSDSVHAVGKIMYVDLFLSTQGSRLSKALMRHLYATAKLNGCQYIWTSRRTGERSYRNAYHRIK